MKTKTLLIAAAALAVGVISSQAQVYSVNVVGYANVVTPTASVNYMMSVPFKIGVSNGANEIFPGAALPEFSQILIWDPNTSSYTTYQTDSVSSTGWSLLDATEVPAPVLPVGQGFFLQPAAGNVTNVFAGSVSVNVGTSNVMTLPTASVNYMVGCVVPYAGSVTNGNNSGGGPNLNGLTEFSQVLIWNPNTSSYTTYQTDSVSSTGWSLLDATEVPAPSITVGQGFFVQPAASNDKWTTGLQ